MATRDGLRDHPGPTLRFQAYLYPWPWADPSQIITEARMRASRVSAVKNLTYQRPSYTSLPQSLAMSSASLPTIICLLLRSQGNVIGVWHGCIGCATLDAFQAPLVRLRLAGTSSATARSAGFGSINKDEPQNYSQHMCFSTSVKRMRRQRRAILLAMAMALDFNHFARVDHRLTGLFHVCFVVSIHASCPF